MRRLRRRSRKASSSRVRSARSRSHFMICATGFLPSMASSRLVTATPKSFSSRRVTSLGMAATAPLRVDIDRGYVGPARRAVGLEILRVHEMQAVMEVHLELAATETAIDPCERLLEK